MSEQREHPYRLPTTVIPAHYEIRIEPDLQVFTFSGEETVTVSVSEPLSEILLNAVDLTIHEVSAQDARGRTASGTATLEPATERARLSFPETLTPGEWKLRLAFAGVLNEKLHGFYRSRYQDGSGAERFLAATQFEATDARKAFPCWDEPDKKAIFSVTLVVDEKLIAISNTRVASETPLPGKPGKKAVRFAETIRMPTYLVAFVVGELEATDPVSVNGTPIRVWCVPGKKHLAKVALEIAAYSLRFFEGYYRIPYPGDKLDLIALPDFASGAMENFGAITFRENALLVDERTATHGEIERVAIVVAHENAHMWFGDLATMAWWNGLWLNEAFATFMEMLAVDAWKPEWETWVAFGVSRAAAFSVDGLQSTRPIEFPVTAPKDADAMFDVLTYEKGAAVLRMLEQHLGPETFREGVSRYLTKHAYANADTRDLWTALGAASGQPIPEVMDGWIFKGGYPIVTVTRDGKSLVLAQRRFTYLPSDDTETWKIPVAIRMKAGGKVETRKLLLDRSEARLRLLGRLDWVVVNDGGHGFYRVRYDRELQAALAGELGHLQPIERFQLLADAWAATVAGLAPIDEYLDLSARFRDETDKNVWSVLLGSFGYLSRVIPPAERSRLEALVRDRLAPAVARLGWAPRAGESDLQRQLRGDLLRNLGTLGNDRAAQEKARQLYPRLQKEPGSVDANIVPALIQILAHSGGEPEYVEFSARLKSSRTPQEEQRYLYSLAAFRQEDLLRQTLERTITGEIRAQDAPFVVRAIFLNVDGREQAWKFVKENWEAMERRFPSKAGIRRMCEGVTALGTPELEADVGEFFASRKIDLGGKALPQYLEQLHVAVAFREREMKRLLSYLPVNG